MEYSYYTRSCVLKIKKYEQYGAVKTSGWLNVLAKHIESEKLALLTEICPIMHHKVQLINMATSKYTVREMYKITM